MPLGKTSSSLKWHELSSIKINDGSVGLWRCAIYLENRELHFKNIFVTVFNAIALAQTPFTAFIRKKKRQRDFTTDCIRAIFQHSIPPIWFGQRMPAQHLYFYVLALSIIVNGWTYPDWVSSYPLMPPSDEWVRTSDTMLKASKWLWIDAHRGDKWLVILLASCSCWSVCVWI